MLRFIQPQEIEPYLSDASQYHGQAEGVIVPENEREVSEFLRDANSKKIPLTVSGGKTGLAGAAVPEGGWILSSEKLSRVLEIRKSNKESWARLEPAIHLKDLERALEAHGLFYPPDPTGPKAFLGGTLATNASGPNSFKYGPTRSYIRRIRTVLADGTILDLKRNQLRARRDGILEIPAGPRKIKIQVPHYGVPSVKHAGGYFSGAGMDAVDLFIGSEGTLGVSTEIEVNLLPLPEEVIAFVVFFSKEEDAWQFAREAREKGEARMLEYFDSGSLEFLRPDYPSIPKGAQACLFVEQEVEETRQAAPATQAWHQFFEKGGALPQIWEGTTAGKREEFRNFRSALPLAVREFLAEHRQIKVGTDTCVPHECFEDLMNFHRRSVEKIGIQSVTFGHIGESHVHLNLLPANEEEAQKARALYPELVQKALSLGGTFSAEHGVGKLKRRFLVELLGEKAIEEMRAVKRAFDPNLILGRGNLFEIK